MPGKSAKPGSAFPDLEGAVMRFDAAVVVAAAHGSGEVVPARAQMATTLGFHIILACLGIALPTIVLLAEFIGLRRRTRRRCGWRGAGRRRWAC